MTRQELINLRIILTTLMGYADEAEKQARTAQTEVDTEINNSMAYAYTDAACMVSRIIQAAEKAKAKKGRNDGR